MALLLPPFTTHLCDPCGIDEVKSLMGFFLCVFILILSTECECGHLVGNCLNWMVSHLVCTNHSDANDFRSMLVCISFHFLSFVNATHTNCIPKNFKQNKLGAVRHIGYVCMRVQFWKSVNFPTNESHKKTQGGWSISMHRMGSAVFACHWFETKPIQMTSVEMAIMVCVQNQNPFQRKSH